MTNKKTNRRKATVINKIDINGTYEDIIISNDTDFENFTQAINVKNSG